MFDFLASAGLTHATAPAVVEQFSKAISFLTGQARSLHRNGNNLQMFLDAVKVAH